MTQQDHEPLHGTFPTTNWDMENLIVDEYVLTIPANARAGKYFIAVGLYDSQTNERLVVTDARGNAFSQNRVPLFEVEW